MSKATDGLLSYIRAVAGTWRNDPRDDAELIARFVESRDEMAFAALVGRHSALVWQTCQRLLGDTPEAEDAFQTVFLALTRKAGRFPVTSLVGWLYRVSRQTALKARASTGRRRKLEHKLQSEAQPETKEDTRHSELYAGMDEELAALPERLRVPLLLHYLEGKSQVEVARILGCGRSTLQERLEKGEATLRKRLERRGLTLGTVSLATLMGNANGASVVPAALITGTARAAVAFRAGTLTGSSAEAAEKLLRSLSLKGPQWKSWWLMLACVGTLGIGGAGLVAWRMAVIRPGTMESSSKPIASLASSTTVSSSPRVDVYGDPLPKDALARIGTVRFRGPGTDWLMTEHINDRRWFKVALSPDGKILASSHDTLWRSGPENGHRHIIRFWDMATGKQLHETVLNETTLIGNIGVDSRIAFSTDGKVLAVAKKRGVWLVDVVTGRPSDKSLSGSWPLAFTPDGKTLACKTQGASFTLYDVGTGKLLRTITVESLKPTKRENPWPSSLSFAAFSRNGRLFAYIEETGMVHLLDFKTGKELATLEEQQVRGLAFTPDGSKFVTAGRDKTIRIWDAQTWKELRQLGTMTEVPSLVDFLADGKTVLAACAGQIRCWDATSGNDARPPLDCKGLLYPQILSADGTKLIERVQDSLSIWDVATGKETGPAASAPRSCMDCLAFSPDGKNLATHSGVSGESEIQLWEVATGKTLGSFAAPVSSPKFRDWEMAWPSRNMLMARAFPDFSMTIQLTKEAAGCLTVKTQTYTDGVKFSSDGCVLACQRGQNIELLEVATGKKLAAVPFPIQNPIRLGVDCSFAFSADHQFFATHTIDDPAIILWEVSTGRKLYSFNIPPISERVPIAVNHPWYDRLIGFSPDGRLVVTQDWMTRDVSLWEHVSGQLRLRLPAPPDCIEAGNVAFSPDSRLLAMGYMGGSKEERSIHMWDLATGQECQCFQGHHAGDCGAPRVVFSPDGRRLASAGMDYTVLIWDVKQPSVIESLSQPLNQKELQTLKTALWGADAATAYRAICRLRQVPKQAVPLASECLRPHTPALGSERIAQEAGRLIDGLDSDDFQTRAKAEEELRKNLHKDREENDPVVENVLRKTLEKKPAIGVSKVISQLLNELADERKWGGALSPELTRMFRGIEVLELIHNDAACEVLQKIVEAPPRPEVRREAEAALKRLAAPAIAPTRP